MQKVKWAVKANWYGKKEKKYFVIPLKQIFCEFETLHKKTKWVSLRGEEKYPFGGSLHYIPYNIYYLAKFKRKWLFAF